MEYSMYKTLAAKYRTTKKTVIQKYRIGKDFGVRYISKSGEEKVRLFWNESLARNPYPSPQDVDTIHKPKGLLKKPTLAMRLEQRKCEWCGRTETDVLVHQVRSLKELKGVNDWELFMKKINRKTLVVCKQCYEFMAT